jgi:glycosyltransferase involved in cell wall biosynthesis
MIVDIILPIFKPNETIYEAIDSVLAQTYKNWHLYIVDDASKD